MRFESKRDLWLVLVLRGIPVAVLAVVFFSWKLRGGHGPGPLIAVALVLGFELLLFETLLRTTYYVIDGGTLIIRSSFLKWRVPIDTIRSVTATRNPLSSPALSLDRLLIKYANGRIMISPEEKQRFIDALRAVNPAIST